MIRDISAGMLERLSNVSVPNLADAMDHQNIECRWLSKNFESLNGHRFSGLADTVEWGPTRKGKDLNLKGPSTWQEVGRFVDKIEKNRMPTVYVAGSKHSSEDFVLAGGLTVTYLNKNGYVGAVLNGAFRDLEEVKSLDFPVWYRNKGIMDSQGCMKVIRRGTSCTVNGFTVFQGDIISGDVNGVIAIDPDSLEAIVCSAEEISEKESVTLKRIREGSNLFDLIEGGGHI